MGERITSQRRGRGTSVYKAPSHRYRAEAKYRVYDAKEKEDFVTGEVLDIMPDPARSSPVVHLKFEDNEKLYLPAVEGVQVGQKISCGINAPIEAGNVLPLSSIPEGTPVNNLELKAGDGGKFIRTSGAYGLIIGHEGGKTTIQLPSGSFKALDSRCRATIGVVAAGGRRDKPIMKGGKAYWMQKSKAKYWPIVRKNVMNVVNHPFGGKSGGVGKPTTTSRNRPPGRKVGLIAARRTGRR